MPTSAIIRWENAACDPSFPIDVKFLRLRAPASVALGRHDYFEVLYMKSGSAIYRVRNRDIVVKQGDLFVIGSGLDHGIHQYLTPSVRAVVLYFHPSLILGDDLNGESAEYLIPFEIQNQDFPHAIPMETGIPAQVHTLLQSIHQEKLARSSHAQLAVKTYLKMILILLMNHYAGNRTTTGTIERKNRDLERLQPLFHYVDRHYVENITVEQAAGLLNMSKSHFMRFFRAVTGGAFVSHLNRFRISRAQHLIASTGRTIAAIGQEVGFCDQSYFGVVFRRFVGMTPREYRDHRRAA